MAYPKQVCPRNLHFICIGARFSTAHLYPLVTGASWLLSVLLPTWSDTDAAVDLIQHHCPTAEGMSPPQGASALLSRDSACKPQRQATKSVGHPHTPPSSDFGATGLSTPAPTPHQNSSQRRVADEHSTVQAFRARVATNRQHAAEEKLRRVNRVLRRAEVSKVANALRKRLEYASFKVQHGWTDKTFREIKDEYARSPVSSPVVERPRLDPISSSHDVPLQVIPPGVDASVAAAASCLMGVSRSPSQESPAPNSPRSPSERSDPNALAHSLTRKLRAETDEFLARLGLPSVYDEKDRKRRAATQYHHPYFPSPAPSPILSRASSPSRGLGGGAAAGGACEDADAEQGALLLMMMQGTRR
ncbi:hypothetical protein HKX48_008178 [Thoreauomyces humboldtii]|nr:hypothetical protein HKX48_008178 [Thoreauomyces humboldtii]